MTRRTKNRIRRNRERRRALQLRGPLLQLAQRAAVSEPHMKVERWISYDESEGMIEAVGGAGGIREGQNRAEFLGEWVLEVRPYIEAIWSALDERGAMSGQEHQDSGVPVFSDGKVATFSMRGWGDLVAAWWNSAHPDEPRRNYCQYAWELPENRC